jgi:hypothetical protein
VGAFSSPKALLRAAQDQHKIFTMVAKPHGRQVVGPSKMLATPWQKPPEGLIKVNWDEAVDGGRKVIGMGAIVRDSDGTVLAMMCDTMLFVQDPVLAEALAARRAIELCLLLGIRKIILEGDALQVVHALQVSNRGPSVIGPIVEDARYLCRRFLDFEVRYVHIGANGEAHRLAKLAFSQDGYSI